MNSFMSESDELSEIQRLSELLPPDLRSQVLIMRSQEVNPELITVKQTGKHLHAIEIDLIAWHQLDFDQCDLLFWHEVARIQGKAVTQSSWELVVLGIGLVFAMTEFASQNILALAITLAVSSVASYRLYQRKRGEHSLRELAAADQGALTLATQFGYSLDEAYNSLYSALKVLSKTARRGRWKTYQVRLRVLEIAKSEAEVKAQSKKFTLNMPLLFQM